MESCHLRCPRHIFTQSRLIARTSDTEIRHRSRQTPLACSNCHLDENLLYTEHLCVKTARGSRARVVDIYSTCFCPQRIQRGRPTWPHGPEAHKHTNHHSPNGRPFGHTCGTSGTQNHFLREGPWSMFPLSKWELIAFCSEWRLCKKLNKNRINM